MGDRHNDSVHNAKFYCVHNGKHKPTTDGVGDDALVVHLVVHDLRKSEIDTVQFNRVGAF